MAFDRSRAVPEPINEPDDPGATSLWDVDWSDPDAVARLRAEIEAEVEREDPEWAAQHREQFEHHWDAAMAALGVTSHPS